MKASAIVAPVRGLFFLLPPSQVRERWCFLAAASCWKSLCIRCEGTEVWCIICVSGSPAHWGFFVVVFFLFCAFFFLFLLFLGVFPLPACLCLLQHKLRPLYGRSCYDEMIIVLYVIWKCNANQLKQRNSVKKRECASDKWYFCDTTLVFFVVSFSI